jgi:hypothetical protein
LSDGSVGSVGSVGAVLEERGGGRGASPPAGCRTLGTVGDWNWVFGGDDRWGDACERPRVAVLLEDALGVCWES